MIITDKLPTTDKVRFVKHALDAASGKPYDWVFHIDATDLDDAFYYDLAFCKMGNKGGYGSRPQRTRAQIIRDMITEGRDSLKGYMVFVSQGNRVKPLNITEAA
jgi:hypothetical protein